MKNLYLITKINAWLKVLALLLCIFLLLMLFLNIFIKSTYPKKYSEYVQKYSTLYNVDSHLVYSVIKAESSFRVNAKSNKGACGLMQLTTSTAKFMADKLHIKKFDLFNAEDNINLGTFYLRYLFNIFENENEVVCAYNAGEGNVREWLKDERFSTDNKTLVNIPFMETKAYVERVGKFKKVYNRVYKQATTDS